MKLRLIITEFRARLSRDPTGSLQDVYNALIITVHIRVVILLCQQTVRGHIKKNVWRLGKISIDVTSLLHGARGRGVGSTPYNGKFGDAPSQRGTFFGLQVYKRSGILQF